MSVTLRITGLEELNRQMKTLPHKVQRRAVIAGLREGAKVIKKAGKMGAPLRQSVAGNSAKFIGDRHGIRFPGFLRRTTIYRTVSKRKALRPTIHIGPRRAAFYGQFFEVGRRGPRRMPRKTWLSDAYRSRNGAALQAIRKGLWRELAKAIDEDPRRAPRG